jgi:hypothetical protein
MPAVNVPIQRGRGWQWASLLLALITGAFAFAYYVPLVRAHSALTEQYKKLAAEAAVQRKQLTDVVVTLKSVSDERDKLVLQSQREHEVQRSKENGIEQLETSVRSTVKKFTGKGRVELLRQDSILKATLATPALIGHGTAEVTALGKQALCAFAGAFKTNGAQVVIDGFGVGAPSKEAFSFTLAAGRAAAVAKQLTEGCKLDAKQLEIRVNQNVTSSTVGVEMRISARN